MALVLHSLESLEQHLELGSVKGLQWLSPTGLLWL